MDLTSILMQSLGDNGIEQIGRQAGMNSSQTSAAMGAVVPMLLGAMAKNSSSPEGASGLLGALDTDHDGSILDDLGGFLGGSMTNSRSANGSGILKHILGGNQAPVESGLANKVGVDSQSIGKLMTIVAPLIMAYLGKQKRSAGSSGFDSGGLGGLLGNLAGGSSQGGGIDIGDIMDMVGGLSGSSSQSSGSSGGGLLGGLLKGFLKNR
jgi:hypothetical protein